MGSLNNSDNFLPLLEFAVLQAPELEGTAPRHSLLRLCSSAAKAGVTRLRGSPKILLHHLALAFTLWKCSLPQEGTLPNVLACASEYRSGHLGQGHLPAQNLLYGGGDQARGLTAPNSSANEVTSTEHGVAVLRLRAQQTLCGHQGASVVPGRGRGGFALLGGLCSGRRVTSVTLLLCSG